MGALDVACYSMLSAIACVWEEGEWLERDMLAGFGMHLKQVQV